MLLNWRGALLLAALAPPPTRAENWAVLVAGSSGYWNYRHQADLCHAYKALIKHGLHPERMITMLYDDVADAEDNPFPGELFNRPDGEDVYKGCAKDYVGNDVTPENFVAVLTGDSARVRVPPRLLSQPTKLSKLPRRPSCTLARRCPAAACWPRRPRITCSSTLSITAPPV